MEPTNKVNIVKDRNATSQAIFEEKLEEIQNISPVSKKRKCKVRRTHYAAIFQEPTKYFNTSLLLYEHILC